jgi:hypothetical protein
MTVFHRSRYSQNGVPFRCSWWQIGDRIFRYRELPGR